MKVCFLVHSLRKDTGYGIDRYSYELINRVGREVDTIIMSQNGFNNRLERVIKQSAFPIRVAKIKADMYHAVSPSTASAAVLTGKHPLVTTIHDLHPIRKSITSFHLKELQMRPLIKLELARLKLYVMLAKRSDCMIVPFEVTKHDLISTLRVQADRIRVIHYGVDITFFRPLEVSQRARYLVGNKIDEKGKKIIMFIGSLSKADGADILMRAFSLLIKEYRNCELWIGGKWKFFDGIKLARELNIIRNVKFLGYIPEKDLPLYYNLADILVFPSRIGFCLPILEGMACKKPIIASNTPDVQEIVGHSGLLIPPTDINKLTHAILSLLSNKKLRNKLACEAYKRSKLFSWERTTEKTINVYNELMSP